MPSRAPAGRDTRPLIFTIEAGENPEHRALAAAGWADEDANLAGAEGKVDTGEHVVPLAGRVLIGLAFDVDLKLHGAATGINGLRMAAPARFR